MSLFQADTVRRGGASSLLYASERDHRHRPASHPVLRGLPRYDTEPVPWPMGASQIRARRKARGLSQYDLGRLVGVSRPAVAQWESGYVRPSPEHEARLRVVLA